MSNQIADSLFDAIDILLDKKINEAGFDRTIKAVIKRVLDETKGKYEIQYEEDIGVAWSVNNNIEYQVNDEVYVMVPGQVGQREKYILSKVQTEEEKAEQESVNQNDYITLGRGVVDWNADFSEDISLQKIIFNNGYYYEYIKELSKYEFNFLNFPIVFIGSGTLQGDEGAEAIVDAIRITFSQIQQEEECEYEISIDNSYKLNELIYLPEELSSIDKIKIELATSENKNINNAYYTGDITGFVFKSIFNIDNNKEDLITLLNATPYIAISADIQFNNMPEFYGNYGLKLKIKEKDKEPYDLIMDINDLEGNPYNQGNADSDLYDSQLKIFNNSHGEIEDILSFEFFVNDLQENQINDFYKKFKIKNIFIYGAEKKNQFHENIIINISQKNNDLILKAFYNKISILKDLLPYAYIINKLSSDFKWGILREETFVDSFDEGNDNEFIIPISIEGQDWYTFSLQLEIKYLKENNKYSYNKNSNILNWNYSSTQQIQLQKRNNSIIRKFIENESNPLKSSVLLGNGVLNKTFKETWENEEPFYTSINREKETNELIHYSGRNYTWLSSWRFTFKSNNDDCFLFYYNLLNEESTVNNNSVEITKKTLHFILSAKFIDGTKSNHREVDTTLKKETPLSKKNPFNYFTLSSLFGATEKEIDYLLLEIGFSCEINGDGLANETKINTNQNELIYFSISQNGINLNGSKKYSNLLVTDFQNDNITIGLEKQDYYYNKAVYVYYNNDTADDELTCYFYYYQFPAPYVQPFYNVIQQEAKTTVDYNFGERQIDEDGSIHTMYFNVREFCDKVGSSKYHRLKGDATYLSNFGVLWVDDQLEGGQSLLGQQSNISQKTYAGMDSVGTAVPILYYKKGTMDYYFISSYSGVSFINIGSHNIPTSIFPENYQFIPEYLYDDSEDPAHRNNLIDETVIKDAEIREAIRGFLNANYILWNNVLNQSFFETSTSEILSIELKSDLHKTEEYYNNTDDNNYVGNIPCVQFNHVNSDNLHFVSQGTQQEIASLQDIETI